MSAHTELDSLQCTLNHAIDAFREELIKADLPPLTLEATEPHVLDNDAYLPSPRLYEARRLVLATIGQLKTLIQYPYEKVLEETFTVYDRSSLKVMVENGLVDYLDGVPDRKKGAHVSDIQKALDMDSRKLTVVLRYLSVGGWVRETEEGTFALNRPSLELLEGRAGRKAVRNILVADVANTLPQWLQHPDWKYSDSVVHTPVQMVLKTQLPLFQWVKTDQDSFTRLMECMRSLGDFNIRRVISDYPWNALQGHTVVDCGGGSGFFSIELAKAFPSLCFVIQDLPEVIPVTQSHVVTFLPQAAADGRVVAEVQDFFKPQNRTGDEYSFMFRYVLHDWPDKDAITILKNIAAAAGPQSKVLIVETISIPGIIHPTTSASDVNASTLSTLTGTVYRHIAPPPFIPANFGAADKYREGLVLHLLGLMNAQGRTLADWKRLVETAGLEVRRVVPVRADVSVIECGLHI